MTYATFHLLWTLPPFLFLGLILATQNRLRSAGWPLLINFLLALVYTTPWDNYLVAHAIWSYPPDRVLGRVGYVPIEEYFFFLIQTGITVLFGIIILSLKRNPSPAQPFFPSGFQAKHLPRVPMIGRGVGIRALGTSTAILVTGLGLILMCSKRGEYLGLILAWSAPVCAIQWACGGDLIFNRFKSAVG